MADSGAPKNSWSRREFLGSVGVAAAGLAGCATTPEVGDPMTMNRTPNILMLVTDDQRWDAMGCAGNAIINTPNMDRLAAEGTRFANTFSTTAICCASRASILTGLYTSAHGIGDFGTPLSEQQFAETYPALLQNAGYYTGFVGKWGLGGPLPESEFDYFDGFSGQGRYFQDESEEGPHLTRRLGDKALEFLAQRPSDQPFCLSLSFKAPHVQDQDPRQFLYDKELEHLYQDVEIPKPMTATEEYFKELPDFVQDSEARRRWEVRFSTPEKYQESVKGYYRLITGVDRAIGRILAELEASEILQDTVVIVTSDQGFFLGEHGLAGKWYMYEESIRMPLIIRDPRVPDWRRAAVRNDMALNLDLAPTILDLAGIEPPPKMQGRSLRPLLGRGRKVWRDDWFYEHHFGRNRNVAIPASEGVRTDDWKYIRWIDSDPVIEELYHVAVDPHEVRNLVSDERYRGRLETMREKWAQWREAAGRTETLTG